MPIGLNRVNDTPIGGAQEFRGNLQAPMSVWNVDNVPAWDGTKFAPAANSGLLLAYGGLASNAVAAVAADGSLIQNWDTLTPLNGTPLQVTIDDVAGTIAAVQAGTYQVVFSANLAGLTNNQEYAFRLNLNGSDTGFGSVISGTNSVATASTSFAITVEAAGGGVLGVSVFNSASNTYEIVSASFDVRRIG